MRARADLRSESRNVAVAGLGQDERKSTAYSTCREFVDDNDRHAFSDLFRVVYSASLTDADADLRWCPQGWGIN